MFYLKILVWPLKSTCMHICMKFHLIISKIRTEAFLDNPHFSSTPSFLEKYFIPTLVAKLEEVNRSLCKGRVIELCLIYTHIKK